MRNAEIQGRFAPEAKAIVKPVGKVPEARYCDRPAIAICAQQFGRLCDAFEDG